MRPGARTALNVLSLGVLPLIRWARKVRANRKAVRAGLPKPYPPDELVGDALELAEDVAHEVTRRERLR